MAKTEEKKLIGEVLLKDVRLSFADIYKPGKDQKNDKGETVPGKYKANGLIDKPETLDHDPKRKKLMLENIKKIKAAADEVKKAKWADKQPKLKPEMVFFRDGDLEDWDGYADCYYVSANNANKPVLITRRKDDKGNWIEAKPGEIYSGCYVNMLIRVWAQDHAEHGKRVNASLECIQFSRKGEPFSGGAPIDPNEKFAEIEEDEGEALGDGFSEEDEDDEVGQLV